MTKQKICKRCVLPSTFPGVSYDEEGECNYCQRLKDTGYDSIKRAEFQLKFESLIKKHRGDSIYDALMCYSGGKDSTYTLAVLKEKYRLNILAVTVDNGFISDQALKNIKTVVENLGVDHIFFKPRFNILAKIFRCCASNDIFSRKSLERASSICTSCMAVVKYSTLRIALEKAVPFIVYGWSPGQSPVTSSIIKNNPEIVKMMQKSLYDPLYSIAGEDIKPYFLEDKHFGDDYQFPYYIHPLAFLGYNEAVAYENIARLGWIPPGDTDVNSTNCLLNSFANMVHKSRLGFHPYVYELSNLVRGGYLNRSTALVRLSRPENPEILRMVKEKLETGTN